MIRAARRLVLTFIFACVVTTFGAGAPAAVAVDSSTTTAVIVIDTGNGTRTELVDVGSGMSGLAVLQQVATVTTYGFAGQGGAVCSIDGIGNDATASACLVGANSQYWAYFHSRNGATSWSYSPVGAGSYTVRGGDVEGWRYGTGQKPAASPTFCDYVACSVTPTPPPPTNAPAGPVGGSAGGTGEGSVAGIPNGVTGGSTGGSANGSAGSTGQPGDPATGTGPTQPATATTAASGPNGDERPKSRKNGDGVNAEAASLRRAGAGDSGSPVGVVVVGALLAVGAGSTWWLRRRARAPG